MDIEKIEHQNTHRITDQCVQSGDYVLGRVDGLPMIGVSMAPGGWKPARIACQADYNYFGRYEPKVAAIAEDKR